MFVRGVFYEPVKEVGMETLRVLVRRFCVIKLAQILYECVECERSDRAVADWLAAERFVVTNPDTIEAIASRFMTMLQQGNFVHSSLDITETLVSNLGGYETFNRFCGRVVWDLLYQRIRGVLTLPHTCVRFG